MKLSSTTLVKIAVALAVADAAPAFNFLGTATFNLGADPTSVATSAVASAAASAAVSVAASAADSAVTESSVAAAPSDVASNTIASANVASATVSVAASSGTASASAAVAEAVAVAPTLSEDDLNQLKQFTAQLNSYSGSTKKRAFGELTARELEEFEKREIALITDILKFVNSTGLVEPIIKFFVTDPVTQPLVIKAIVALLKSGLIDLTAVMNALDDSGLASSVITQIISDCTYYPILFNDAKQIIGDLLPQVLQKISGNSKRALEIEVGNVNYGIKQVRSEEFSLEARADIQQSVLTSFFESLKNSGLASSLIDSILRDPDYIPFAEKLITAIIDNKALDLSEVVKALKDSTLLEDLFKEFFKLSTLKTVIVNAFAAAAGKCGGVPSGSSVIPVSSTTKPASSATGTGTGTATATTTSKPSGNCRRRRKREYNY